MHRFLCPPDEIQKGLAVIRDKNEVHHLKTVLCLQTGEEVVVFDGKGREAAGKITSIDKSSFTVSLEKTRSAQIKTTRLCLACAIPKKAKFENIVEKTTELNIDEIVPLKTQRTEILFNQDKALKKVFRYQTIALNAAKQSQRKTIPVIHPVIKFSQFLKDKNPDDIWFICALGEKQNTLLQKLIETKKLPSKITLLVGPEGDFTPAEIEQAIKAGCVPVSLGKTVLKVDTAAIVASALANLIIGSHE